MSWEFVIDTIKEWILDQSYLTHAFVDRGDPAVIDYDKDDLIVDGSWHELDLSGIVSEGATAVLIRTIIRGPNVDFEVWFQEHSNVNSINQSQINIQVANITSRQDLIVAIDANRKIDYRAAVIAWTKIDIIVGGWWL